ncbi:MAG: hypothetical protein ACRDHL_07680 [Candidatus Promineifilaceae bacterium]
MAHALVGVECRFAADGTVDVSRVFLDGRWQPVGQGRQWADRQGRHVLVMLEGHRPRELLLRSDTTTWELRPLGPEQALV